MTGKPVSRDLNLVICQVTVPQQLWLGLIGAEIGQS